MCAIPFVQKSTVKDNTSGLARHTRTAPFNLLTAMLVAALCLPTVVFALAHFDFDQKFFVHPGKEIWDFCLIRHEGVYHLYYINVDEGVTGAKSDNLGHATSPDLMHWEIHSPAITRGGGWWENTSVWAPDVVRDEANNRWVMAYTGVDSLNVQRPCIAYSADLYYWIKEPANPLFEPDTLTYFWNPDMEWSAYRDPFLYYKDGEWNMLSTASLRLGTYPGSPRGIIHRLSSTDFANWTDRGVFFESDGDEKWRDLESCQYLEIGGKHHLFLSVYNIGKVTHMVGDSPADWSMLNASIIDSGTAPDIKSFDPGVYILGRWGSGFRPATMTYYSHARFDTIDFSDPTAPVVLKPHPLMREWESYNGFSVLGNPTFGDNPVERGEPSVGLVGNGYFGSLEYYPGPLSGVGAPGAALGPGATGTVLSGVFTIEGDFIDMLVGGGEYPETCYVALEDADTGAILFKETGEDETAMTPRRWNVRSLEGRDVRIRIVDNETSGTGYINVDEIHEIMDAFSHAPASPGRLSPRAVPNPFNPTTEIRFDLPTRSDLQVTIHDLRGREIWRSPAAPREAGPVSIVWRGVDRENRPVASGSYIFRIRRDGVVDGIGKLVLAR